MAIRVVHQLTTAPSGAGKTYLRCARFLVEEWLPEHSGDHWSNFPIGIVPENRGGDGEETYMDRIARYVVARRGGYTQKYLDRMKLIPSLHLQAWTLDTTQGGSGPWHFFRDLDITGAHIAIDEIHNYCGKHHSKKHRQEWSKFLGELRHKGATCEFISQSPDKIASEIHYEAGLKRELVPSINRVDPYFSIPMGDWYELGALVTGRYLPCVYELERVPGGGKEWKVERERRFYITGEYFPLYDSYSAPVQGGSAAAEATKHEFQRRTPPGLVAWFLRKNWLAIVSSRYLWALVVCVFLMGGGGYYVMTSLINRFTAITMRNVPKKLEDAPAGEVVRSAPSQPSNHPTTAPSVNAGPIAATQSAKAADPPLPPPIRVVLLSPGVALLSNGTRCFNGDMIDVYGNKMQVQRIDTVRQTITVGGRVFVLGQPWLRVPPADSLRLEGELHRSDNGSSARPAATASRAATSQPSSGRSASPQGFVPPGIAARN